MNFLVLLLALVSVITVGNAKKWPTEPEPSPISSTLSGNICGGISPLTRWERTGRSDTIQMNIDTSKCEFQSTPMYFTSISGEAGHYLLIGVNAIYEATKNGFLINVHSSGNESADRLMAWSAQYKWNVNWFGVLP